MRYPHSRLSAVARVLAGAGALTVTLAACSTQYASAPKPGALTPLPSSSPTGASTPDKATLQPGGTRRRTPSRGTREHEPGRAGPGSRPSPGLRNPSGSSSPAAPSTSSSHPARPTKSPVPTAAELQAALLTLAELPNEGFQVEPSDSGTDPGSLLADCPFATVGQVSSIAQESETFSAGSTGPDISEMLLQYPVSVAKGQMEQFAETANTCSSFPVSYHGVVLKIDITREAFPSFGDDTVALRISADVISAHNLTVDSDVVVVRRGGTMILVTNAGIPLDTGLTRTMVAAAEAKVAAR